MQEGIGDYCQPIERVATETRKSAPLLLLYAGGLSVFMSVSVEMYSSSHQLEEQQHFMTNVFFRTKHCSGSLRLIMRAAIGQQIFRCNSVTKFGGVGRAVG